MPVQSHSSVLNWFLAPAVTWHLAISNTSTLSNPLVVEESGHPSCRGGSWGTGEEHVSPQGAQELTAEKGE